LTGNNSKTGQLAFPREPVSAGSYLECFEMTERTLRSAPKEGADKLVDVREDYNYLVQELRMLETERMLCHDKSVLNKSGTIEFYKRKNYSVFSNLRHYTLESIRTDKLLPINDDNLAVFQSHNRRLRAKLNLANYYRAMAIRGHTKQHRLVAEDKLIQARIKKEEAAEKALAKKRKRDK
jgi:hypothetical protein